VQANPQDTQSLEILKGRYARLGLKKEMIATARTTRGDLCRAGQFSAAIVEYEAILKHEPDTPEIIAAMGDVEERMAQAAKSRPAPPACGRPAIALDFRAVLADYRDAHDHRGHAALGGLGGPARRATRAWMKWPRCSPRTETRRWQKFSSRPPRQRGYREFRAQSACTEE